MSRLTSAVDTWAPSREQICLLVTGALRLPAKGIRTERVWTPEREPIILEAIAKWIDAFCEPGDIAGEAVAAGLSDTALRQPTAEVWGRAAELAMAELARLYDFGVSQRQAIGKAIQIEPRLVPILEAAKKEIGKHFGSEAETVLRVVADPEAEGYEELFALVRTSVAPERAVEMLHRLDDEWLVAATQGLRYDFCIDVEFV